MRKIYMKPLAVCIALSVEPVLGTETGKRADGHLGKENNTEFEEESLPVDKDLWGNPVEEEE